MNVWSDVLPVGGRGRGWAVNKPLDHTGQMDVEGGKLEEGRAEAAEGKCGQKNWREDGKFIMGFRL